MCLTLMFHEGEDGEGGRSVKGKHRLSCISCLVGVRLIRIGLRVGW